jgi:hypothetical protein
MTNSAYPSCVADQRKRNRRTKATPGRATAPQSQRYTPPVPVHVKSSSPWVGVFMFGCFILGVAVIVLNYLPGAPGIGYVGHLIGLPNDTSNGYLLLGLGLILLGFVFATRYR